MSEGNWHKKVRKELIEKYEKDGYKVKSSHNGQKLFLFRGILNRKNILSDVDLAIFKDDKIVELVEIQQSLRPKEIIGIIVSTNLSDKCKIDGKECELSNVKMKLVIKKPKEKSNKNNQLKLIKENLFLQNGCIKDFDFIEYD